MKFIDYKYTSQGSIHNGIRVNITEQVARQMPRKLRITISNREHVDIAMCDCPEFYDQFNIIYLRGADSSRDSRYNFFFNIGSIPKFNTIMRLLNNAHEVNPYTVGSSDYWNFMRDIFDKYYIEGVSPTADLVVASPYFTEDDCEESDYVEEEEDDYEVEY